MAGIQVVTDSACDLPPEVVDEFGISVVPLTVRFGAEELVDRRELSPGQFWARMATAAELPETAAPSPGAFQEAFSEAARAGFDGVVCVCLSSALSATFQSAKAAAGSAEIPVRVLDSRSITLGEGMIVMGTARAARQGASLEEACEVAADLVQRCRVYGALGGLEALRKGGRIGGAAAFLGSVLSIKPIIEVRNGVVEAESRQRTRQRALRYLVDKVRQHPDLESLAVLDADAPDVEEFLDMLAEHYPRDSIVVGQVGPVIGTHAGRGTLGVAFFLGRS
ncbi:MAG TPA: DegV family protein [Acidimicrobiales bacterium]|nr:DegV family protein [Acidimicrobiales bacterium]